MDQPGRFAAAMPAEQVVEEQADSHAVLMSQNRAGRREKRNSRQLRARQLERVHIHLRIQASRVTVFRQFAKFPASQTSLRSIYRIESNRHRQSSKVASNDELAAREIVNTRLSTKALILVIQNPNKP